MPPAFHQFETVVRELAPRTAIVLGSGLAASTSPFRGLTTVAFGSVPGLATPSVPGHGGRLTLGHWGDVPLLIFFGRLHYYEGHTRDGVTSTVRIAAELGVKVLVLTNAAGGIHPRLAPGSLMAIRGHVKIVGRGDWRTLATGGGVVTSPYSPRLLRVVREHAQAPEETPLLAGVYAALTGPCYETPAEIRALANCAVDAVGMSTALEAEAAADLGLEVAGLSCVTNRAAGLSAGPLDHSEVLVNAKLGAERLMRVLGALVCEPPPAPAFTA